MWHANICFHGFLCSTSSTFWRLCWKLSSYLVPFLESFVLQLPHYRSLYFLEPSKLFKSFSSITSVVDSISLFSKYSFLTSFLLSLSHQSWWQFHIGTWKTIGLKNQSEMVTWLQTLPGGKFIFTRCTGQSQL